MISTGVDRTVARSAGPHSTQAIGIYSEDPGFVGSSHVMQNQHENEIPVAVVGIVPCRVSTKNGAIRRGDLLATSSTPGHRMRTGNPSPGAILGKALGGLTVGMGVIPVLITLQ